MAAISNNNNSNEHLPLQKCLNGEEVRNLSDVEILALIINTGIKGSDVLSLAQFLLKRYGTLYSISQSGINELIEIKGLGPKKALRIHAAIEFGRRCIDISPRNLRIDSPEAAWRLLRSEIAGLSREEFRILALNNKNHVLKKCVISVGTISQTLVHPREIFRDAIRENASALIVAHNHPSNDIEPSKEDILTTKRLVDAGKLIGIPVLDHIILSHHSYLSLKEAGYLE